MNKNFLSYVVAFASRRMIHTSQNLSIKEIVATRQGKTTTIEGRHVPSPREKYMIKSNEVVRNACILCRLNLDVKHTDVLILHQFVRSDGCMLPKRITGLCQRQQKKISNMVSMAQKAGLLIPPGSKIDPSKRKDYKKFNTYYDESTIKTW